MELWLIITHKKENSHQDETLLFLNKNPGKAIHKWLSSVDTDRWKSDKPPSLYIFINSSTRDLSSIEKYVVCLE
jgi:hypothetical protein